MTRQVKAYFSTRSARFSMGRELTGSQPQIVHSQSVLAQTTGPIMGRFEAQPPQFENGEQPIEGGETKRERWLRIMNERISEFQQIIRDKFYPPLIDRKGNYEYTEEDAQKVISLLRNEIEILEQTLQDPKKHLRFVDLRFLIEPVTEDRVREIITEELIKVFSLALRRKGG